MPLPMNLVHMVVHTLCTQGVRWDVTSPPKGAEEGARAARRPGGGSRPTSGDANNSARGQQAVVHNPTH